MKTSEENAQSLINWLAVLSNGYVKPDVNKGTSNVHGVVRDTKKFFPFIDSINERLCELLDVTVPVVDTYKNDQHEY